MADISADIEDGLGSFLNSAIVRPIQAMIAALSKGNKANPITSVIPTDTHEPVPTTVQKSITSQSPVDNKRHPQEQHSSGSDTSQLNMLDNLGAVIRSLTKSLTDFDNHLLGTGLVFDTFKTFWVVLNPLIKTLAGFENKLTEISVSLVSWGIITATAVTSIKLLVSTIGLVTSAITLAIQDISKAAQSIAKFAIIEPIVGLFRQLHSALGTIHTHSTSVEKSNSPTKLSPDGSVTPKDADETQKPLSMLDKLGSVTSSLIKPLADFGNHLLKANLAVDTFKTFWVVLNPLIKTLSGFGSGLTEIFVSIGKWGIILAVAVTSIKLLVSTIGLVTSAITLVAQSISTAVLTIIRPIVGLFRQLYSALSITSTQSSARTKPVENASSSIKDSSDNTSKDADKTQKPLSMLERIGIVIGSLIKPLVDFVKYLLQVDLLMDTLKELGNILAPVLKVLTDIGKTLIGIFVWLVKWVAILAVVVAAFILFGDVLIPIMLAMRQIGMVILIVCYAIQALIAIVKFLVTAVGMLISGLITAAKWIVQLAIIEPIVGLFNQLYAALTMNFSKLGSCTESLEKFNRWLIDTFVTAPIKGFFDQMASQAKAALAPLESITSSMSEFVSALTSASHAMEPFVAALAPGLVQQFHYSLRILQATIGTALAPAFQILSAMIRDVAGAIAPAMSRLAPILADLAQHARELLIPAIVEMAEIMVNITSIATGIIGVITPIITMFRVLVTAAIMTIFGWIRMLIGSGGDAANFFKTLRSAVETFAKYLILTAARIALLFGFTSFVDNLKKTIADLGGEGKRPQGVAPAPENVHTTDLESIAKQMAEAAVIAGGGPGGDDPQLAAMKDILDELKKMNSKDWFELLTGSKSISDLIITDGPRAVEAGMREAWKFMWDDIVTLPVRIGKAILKPLNPFA